MDCKKSRPVDLAAKETGAYPEAADRANTPQRSESFQTGRGFPGLPLPQALSDYSGHTCGNAPDRRAGFKI